MVDHFEKCLKDPTGIDMPVRAWLGYLWIQSECRNKKPMSVLRRLHQRGFEAPGRVYFFARMLDTKEEVRTGFNFLCPECGDTMTQTSPEYFACLKCDSKLYRNFDWQQELAHRWIVQR